MKLLGFVFVLLMSVVAATSLAQSPPTTPATPLGSHDSSASNEKTDHPAKDGVSPAHCYDTPMPP
jgi:hypothetical protein